MKPASHCLLKINVLPGSFRKTCGRIVRSFGLRHGVLNVLGLFLLFALLLLAFFPFPVAAVGLSGAKSLNCAISILADVLSVPQYSIKK